MIFANFPCARHQAGPGTTQGTCKALLVSSTVGHMGRRIRPCHQHMSQSLCLGLAEQSPRGSRVLFGQAEAIPGEKILAHHS